MRALYGGERNTKINIDRIGGSKLLTQQKTAERTHVRPEQTFRKSVSLWDFVEKLMQFYIRQRSQCTVMRGRVFHSVLFFFCWSAYKYRDDLTRMCAAAHGGGCAIVPHPHNANLYIHTLTLIFIHF